MIATIGSLVQETSTRWRWVRATGLYIVGCAATSALLGTLLGSTGSIIQRAVCGSVGACRSLGVSSAAGAPVAEGAPVPSTLSMLVVGGLAIAYALSDAGFVRLPRPHVMYAVPVTWWRWWQPYGGALAYGAALGLGFTTYIHFGAFYVLCVWSLFMANSAYGALLLGVYGVARALALLPASYGVYCRPGAADQAHHRLVTLLDNLRRIRTAVAGALILFGVYLALSAVL